MKLLSLMNLFYLSIISLIVRLFNRYSNQQSIIFLIMILTISPLLYLLIKFEIIIQMMIIVSILTTTFMMSLKE